MAEYEQSDESNNSLKIIQINLAHAIKATKTLNNRQIDFQQEISVLQEPYTLNNKVIGFPLKHRIVAHSEEPKAAIVIHNEEISMFPFHTSDCIVAVRIVWRGIALDIVNCYFPPRANIVTMLVKLESVIKQLDSEHLLVMGDFNAKNPVWGGSMEDQRGSLLFEFFTRNNLIVLNSSGSIPTFSTVNGKSWIDISAVNQVTMQEVNNWEVLDVPSESDHRYIMVDMFHKTVKRQKRLTAKGELRILEELRQDDWLKAAGEYDIDSPRKLDIIIEHFYEKIAKLEKKHAKYINNPKKDTKSWWSTELEIERKKVRAMRRRYQRHKGDMRDEFRNAYLKAFKTYNDNLEKAKEKSWKEFCAHIKDKNPFTLPYKIATQKIKKKLTIPSITKSNGECTRTEIESLEYILGELYEIEVNTDAGIEQQEEVKNNEQVVITKPITVEELDFIIGRLKKHIAPGPDNIKTTFIQTLYLNHKKFFLNIYNASIRLAHFPTRWKITRVIFIPKNKDRVIQTEADIRPLAINSILGKILEKIINNRLYHHLVISKLLPQNQYGFTHGTSAVDALADLKEKIERSIEEKKQVLIVSLDIKNAFGHLNKKNVCNALVRVGAPQYLKNIIVNILDGRIITYEATQATISYRLKKGSPQGSPLSPLLWNLVIAELLREDVQVGTDIQAYADDITFITKGNSRKQLEDLANSTLRNIYSWSERNNLRFNTRKCEYLVVGKKYTSKPPKLVLAGEAIKCVKEIKILGLIFDRTMSFVPHLEYIKKKISTYITVMAKFTGVNWGMKPHHLRKLYIRGFERMILYAAPVWYNGKVREIRKLRAIQRIPLIKICKAFSTVSNKTLNIMCNVPPVHLTIEKENTMYRILRGKEDFEWENETYDRTRIACKVDISHTHPADRKVINFCSSIQNSKYYVYTDGSKEEKNTGAAFVIFDKGGNLIVYKMYKLPEYSSNFEAEAAAITEALKYLGDMEERGPFQIITDCLSILKGLNNMANVNPFICAIKNQVGLLEKSHDITFTFVRGHSGEWGNECADELAKKAAKTGASIDMPITKAFIKQQLYKRCLASWNKEWIDEDNTSYTKQWVKSVHCIPETFPMGYYATQALSGHGQFPFYLKRFTIIDSEMCSCGMIGESFDHYLTTCKLTEKECKELRLIFGSDILKYRPEIVSDKKSINLIEGITKKINEITQQR